MRSTRVFWPNPRQCKMKLYVEVEKKMHSFFMPSPSKISQGAIVIYEFLKQVTSVFEGPA